MASRGRRGTPVESIRPDSFDREAFFVKETVEKGRGVFTKKEFGKDEFLLPYEGKLLTEEPNVADDKYIYELSFKRKDFWIDATSEDGSFGRLLNDDHYRPNCRPKVINIEGNPVICFFSLRPIPPGTELLYDYGPGKMYPWRRKTSKRGACNTNPLKHVKESSRQITSGVASEHGGITIITKTGKLGATFTLKHGYCLFGSGKGCNIRVQVPNVSKEHAEIVVKPSGVYIVPLKKWSTALNDVLINIPTKLSNNDIIKIGGRKFVYSLPGNQRESISLDNVPSNSDGDLSGLISRVGPGSKSKNASDTGCEDDLPHNGEDVSGIILGHGFDLLCRREHVQGHGAGDGPGPDDKDIPCLRDASENESCAREEIVQDNDRCISGPSESDIPVLQGCHNDVSGVRYEDAVAPRDDELPDGNNGHVLNPSDVNVLCPKDGRFWSSRNKIALENQGRLYSLNSLQSYNDKEARTDQHLSDEVLNGLKDGNISDSLEKESNLSDSLEKEGNISDSLEKEGNISDSLEKDGNLSDSLEKEGNISDSLEKDGNLSDSLEKEGNISESLEKEGNISDSLEKGVVCLRRGNIKERVRDDSNPINQDARSPGTRVVRLQRSCTLRSKDTVGFMTPRSRDEVGNTRDSTEAIDTYGHVDCERDDAHFFSTDSSDSDYLPTKDTDLGSSDEDSKTDSSLHLPDPPRVQDYVSDSDSDASDKSIVVAIPLPSKAISVQKTKTVKGKQKWDKKHSCKYCGKLYPKLARHLEVMHKDEVLVAKALSLPKNSAERKKIWKAIRNDGDWDHNFNVLKNGSGILIPKYREGKTRAHDEFIPCSGCKGLYSKTSLSEHFKICVGKKTEKKNQGVKEGRSLLPIPEHINGSFYKDVLMTMIQDDIYTHIYRDPLILKFGKRLYENKDIQEHTSNHISCRMRELGRLIGEAKKQPEYSINKVEDCFAPGKFNHVVSCVKSLAGFSKETHLYSTPSLALKMGYSLQRCARIHRSDGIIESDRTKQDNGSAFIQLYESDWSDLISSRARQTLSEKKYNSPKMLPLSEDVFKLNAYLKEKIKELLPKVADNAAFYSDLAKVTLCHITLFNRKRGGDVQRITVENYNRAIEAQNNIPQDSEIKSSLSDLELELCRSLTRIELKGKQERKVAILLTQDMIKSINLLIEKRSDANVCGKYIFARPSPSIRPLRARDVLTEICEKVELQYGHLMTYTNLRKHIATMAQIHELSENGQDQLAKFLGHDIRIHREIYRQPLDIIQKTKISKMLMLINEGKDVIEMPFNNEEEVKEADTSVDEDHSEEEMDDSQDLHTVTQGKRKAQSTREVEGTPCKRQKVLKKPWTSSEMKSVTKHFRHFISMMKVPGKDDITNVLRKDKNLSKRTWRNVKDQVYNLIKKQKKC